MGEVTRYTWNSIKKGYKLLRGDNLANLDRRIERLKHKNDLNEKLLEDVVNATKNPKKLDPYLEIMGNRALRKRNQYSDHLARLEGKRNFEENKTNVARAGMLGAVGYGTFKGAINAIPQAEIPDYVNPDGSPYYTKTASENLAFNNATSSHDMVINNTHINQMHQEAPLELPKWYLDNQHAIDFMILHHAMNNPELYKAKEKERQKAHKTKTAGNIPRDTSKPTDGSPSEAADYYDFHEYLLDKEPHPDRKDLPQLNLGEWANAPQKIAHDLGVDLYTVNVIEEELGLRDRMPVKEAAAAALPGAVAPKAGRAKPGSTLLGLAIIATGAGLTNKAIIEQGLQPKPYEDVRPSYAQ